MSKAIAKRTKKSEHGDLLLILLVAAFTVPIFRSGIRTNLTFFQFTVNHSIWGPPVEYLPVESYSDIFAAQKRLTT